jgi:hypothetical protein
MNRFEIKHLAAWVARDFAPDLQLQIFVKIHEFVRDNPSKLGYASWLEILELAQDEAAREVEAIADVERQVAREMARDLEAVTEGERDYFDPEVGELFEDLMPLW